MAYEVVEGINYRCTECDLCFTADDVTGMDENGNDLCPACGKAITEEDIDPKN